jgi:hypothetical protein
MPILKDWNPHPGVMWTLKAHLRVELSRGTVRYIQDTGQQGLYN